MGGERKLAIGWVMGLLLIVNWIGNVLPNLPGQELLREVGVAGYATALLWLTTCIMLWKRSRRPVAAPQPQCESLAAAA